MVIKCHNRVEGTEIGDWTSELEQDLTAESILPSISTSIPTPFQPIHHQTKIFPPPCLTVGWVILSESASPAFFHTYWCPSDPILLILVSSDNKSFFQSSTVQFWYLRAKLNMAFLCQALSKGFASTTALIRCCFKVFLTVLNET